jgi:hypothetical protein
MSHSKRNSTLGNNMKVLSLLGTAALACCLLPATAWATCTGDTNPSLIQNGGFEAAGIGVPKWKVFDTSDADLTVSSEYAKGGTKSLDMASIGGENRVSQTIATTAGSVYTVCFWASPGNNQGASSLRAQWNNQDYIVLRNIGDTANGRAFVYYQFSAVATGNDVLSFEERNDPSEFFVDNVDVQLCSNCEISSQSLPAKKKPSFAPFPH